MRIALTEADLELCKNSLLFTTKSDIQDRRDLRAGVVSDAPNRSDGEHRGLCETSDAVPVLGVPRPQVGVQRFEEVDVGGEENLGTRVEDDNLDVRVAGDLVDERVEVPKEGVALDV